MLQVLFTALLLTGQPTGGQIPPIAGKPTDRTTGPACGLYIKPSTQAALLSIVPSGAQVQVIDSSNNAHFVWAQFSKNGKVMTGYMYRACLSVAP